MLLRGAEPHMVTVVRTPSMASRKHAELMHEIQRAAGLEEGVAV